MNIQKIVSNIAKLDAKIAKLTQQREALRQQGASFFSTAIRKETTEAVTKTPKADGRKKRKPMSAATKAKMRAAAKERWAKKKAGEK
jgi:hypothetical protein